MKYAKAQAQRGKVLQLARRLARSGQHENHRSIIAELAMITDFTDAHGYLVDRVISAQLDRLCAMAQASEAKGSLAVFLADMRAGPPPVTLHRA
jgi:hypothetical protein